MTWLSYYLTELLLDWAIAWLSYDLTELLLDWASTWLSYDLTELLLDWAMTWLSYYLTELLLDWAITWLSYDLTELLLDWAMTWLSYYLTELLLDMSYDLTELLLDWAITWLSYYLTELLLDMSYDLTELWLDCAIELRSHSYIGSFSTRLPLTKIYSGVSAVHIELSSFPNLPFPTGIDKCSHGFHGFQTVYLRYDLETWLKFLPFNRNFGVFSYTTTFCWDLATRCEAYVIMSMHNEWQKDGRSVFSRGLRLRADSFWKNVKIYILRLTQEWGRLSQCGTHRVKRLSQLVISDGHRQVLAWFSDCLPSLWSRDLALASGDHFHVKGCKSFKKWCSHWWQDQTWIFQRGWKLLSTKIFAGASCRSGKICWKHCPINMDWYLHELFL